MQAKNATIPLNGQFRIYVFFVKLMKNNLKKKIIFKINDSLSVSRQGEFPSLTI